MVIQSVRGWLKDAITGNIDVVLVLKLDKLSRLTLFVRKSRFSELHTTLLMLVLVLFEVAFLTLSGSPLLATQIVVCYCLSHC